MLSGDRLPNERLSISSTNPNSLVRLLAIVSLPRDWKHASGWNVNAEYLYGELEKRGIPVVIMEPIRGGSLARLPEHLTSRLKTLRPEDSAASWSFRFNASFPDVMTVLSGMTYMEHLEENVRTFSPVVECSDDEKQLLEEIATLLLEYPLVPCMVHCPQTIKIPDELHRIDQYIEKLKQETYST